MRRLLLAAVILGAAFWVLAVAVLVQRRDAVVLQDLSQLRPGLTQPEVQAILKPFRADQMVQGDQGDAEYLVRGIDEFIIVVMDGEADDARVRQVKHLPDVGPWWERSRRNWEARFR